MQRFVFRFAVLMAFFVFLAGMVNAAEKEGGSPAGEAKNQAQVKEAPAQPSEAASKAVMGGTRVTEMIGKSVINTKGDKLGRVEDLVLSKDGCAEYIILGHGGLLGIANKLIPIPWKSVQTGAQSDVLIVNVSKEDLQKAPTFETQRWPDFANPEWRKKIFEFFGVKSGNEEKKSQ